MTTQTLTLTDFLLARIAEDEEAASRAQYDLEPRRLYTRERVLAECEAKRTLIDSASYHYLTWEMLTPFAAAYAAHPDYREEWRP